MLELFFRLSENQTTVRTKVLAGVTTFLRVVYIVVAQPAVLSGRMFGLETGIVFGAATTATRLAATLVVYFVFVRSRMG